MVLMLAAMVTAIGLGIVFRKHEAIWQTLIALLAAAVTTLYFAFPGRLM